MRRTLHYSRAISLLTLFALRLQARDLIFTSDIDAITGHTADAQCLLYHGAYDGVSVLSTTEPCGTDLVSSLTSGRIMPDALIAELLDVDEDAFELLHVQEARTTHTTSYDASSLAFDERIAQHARDLMQNTRNADTAYPHAQQRVFTPSPGEQDAQALYSLIQTLHRPPLLLREPSKTSGIYAIPRNLAPIADMLFPEEAVLVHIPTHSLSSPATPRSLLFEAPQWLNNTLRNLQFNPLIDAIIDDIEPHALRKDVRHLTGEDGKAAWISRHSFTSGAKLAAAWIKGGLPCVLRLR